MKKSNSLFLVLCVSVATIFAQDLKTTEVNVVEGFKPLIPEATRLNENAVFADTIKEDRTQIYEVVDSELQSDYKTKPLKAAKVKDDKIPELFATKVSLGTGYKIGSKASIIYNSLRSKDRSYGIVSNHQNSNYRIDDKIAGSSNNNLHLYGKKISAKHIFISNLDYERIGVFTYGIGTDKKDIEGFENNPYYNRFAYTKFSISSISTEKTSDKMIRNTTFFVSDFNEFSENQIHLGTELEKTINGLPFALEIELNDYLNYNSKDLAFESSDVKSFHFFPSTSIAKYGIDFDFGVELHYQIQLDDNEFEIFPQIKASKELVKDILLVYGGLRHSEHRHTLKSLSDENPYTHSYGTNQSILAGNNVPQSLETTDSDELFVGMRNVLGKDEVFEGSLAYGEINNFAHFIGISNGGYNRFQVNYLESVWQLHANATYDKKINNIISLSAAADYFSWDKEVYHKPNFTANLSTPINLRNKIKVIPSVSYMDKRESISYFVSEFAFSASSYSELPPQFHADLSFYYSYSKQLSTYLQLNNLTGKQNEIWKDYKEVGFNGVFGVNYSF
jgi:hypothetical protein